MAEVLKREVGITPELILKIEELHFLQVKDLATSRYFKHKENRKENIIDVLLRKVIIISSIVGLFFSILYMVPLGICRVDYPFGTKLFLFFLVLLVVFWNIEKVSEVLWAWIINKATKKYSSTVFGPMKIGRSYIEQYTFGEKIECVRVSMGAEIGTWQVECPQEYFEGEGFILLYMRNVILPVTTIFCSLNSEIERHLVEIGLVKLI